MDNELPYDWKQLLDMENAACMVTPRPVVRFSTSVRKTAEDILGVLYRKGLAKPDIFACPFDDAMTIWWLHMKIDKDIRGFNINIKSHDNVTAGLPGEGINIGQDCAALGRHIDQLKLVKGV